MILGGLRSYLSSTSGERTAPAAAEVAPASEAEERERVTSLRDAQQKASALFDEIERTILRSGVKESELNKEILALGQERHGVRTHWHKRVIRSGPNTLHPYRENPPDRTIEEDDILFVDLGPVFEQWEADFGRTFVLGQDPVKIELRDSLDSAWQATKDYFNSKPDITGDELYAFACKEAEKRGYEFGGEHSGHLIGDFPHERIADDKITCYITEGNDLPMRRRGLKGTQLHWILEMHLVDRQRQIGGFFEQLLTVD